VFHTDHDMKPILP